MGIFLCLSKKKRRAYALNDRERMETLDSKDTTAQWPGRKKKHTFLSEKTMGGSYHDIFWTIIGAEATEN